MIRIGPIGARVLLAGSAAAAAAAAVITASGGAAIQLGPLTLRAHDPFRAVVLSLLLAAAAAAGGRATLTGALEWWWAAIERRAADAAVLVAVAATLVGIGWNTYVAGGSDSYCYLNQAELFVQGRVHDFEPLGADAGWPGTAWAFVPAGHMPYAATPGATVPICPAGYPFMLAGARAAFGRTAMFFVTPLAGGLTVWLAFVLGRRLSGGAAGLLASLLTAASATMLMQIVQPMNDVPAAALWTAALVLAASAIAGPSSRGLVRAAALSGLVTGCALTVRPNLAPLALVVGFGAALLPRAASLRERATAVVAFGAAALPGVVVVMLVQKLMYGSPFSSGYGDLSALFSSSHVLPNLRRYPRWLLEAHTPAIAAAIAAPLVVTGAARRGAVWLLAFAAATIACYLPYVVFEAWWYTRFLLPAIPALLVLTATVTIAGLRLARPALRPVLYFAVTTMLVISCVTIAARRDVFEMRTFESRFRAAGELVAQALPASAAVITVHHSGSVRFYSGRSTIAWSDIDAGRLDDALAFLRRHGRKPYFLLETWEEPQFRERFTADRLGRLDWAPLAVVDAQVRIYNPDDAPGGPPSGSEQVQDSSPRR